MKVARVPSHLAQMAIQEMLKNGLIDRDIRIRRSENEVLIPLRPKDLPESLKSRYSIELIETKDEVRDCRKDPFNMIQDRLKDIGLSNDMLNMLPKKWELLGDVLILRLPDALMKEKTAIAEIYSQVLGARTVLNDEGAISGSERIPKNLILLGTGTETVHLENGIKYSFDTKKIMFSSGNIDERIRMSKIDCDDEIILDMFAGIGYLSLPMAVHGNPKKIFACEIRRLSFEYLEKNIQLNRVERSIVSHHGDNRDFIPPEKADRIIMGYLKDTYRFLPKALDCLKSGGIIHYHENCPNELLPERILDNLKNASGQEWELEIISNRMAKSFSPGVSHTVTDARFTLS